APHPGRSGARPATPRAAPPADSARAVGVGAAATAGSTAAQPSAVLPQRGGRSAVGGAAEGRRRGRGRAVALVLDHELVARVVGTDRDDERVRVGDRAITGTGDDVTGTQPGAGGRTVG